MKLNFNTVAIALVAAGVVYYLNNSKPDAKAKVMMTNNPPGTMTAAQRRANTVAVNATLPVVPATRIPRPLFTGGGGGGGGGSASVAGTHPVFG